MNALEFILLLIALAAVGFGIYVVYGELDRTDYQVVPLDSGPSLTPRQEFSQSKQFYPNLRFKDRVISYSFDPRCTDGKKQQIAEAFVLFEEETIVEFVPTLSEPDLFIACSELAPEPESEGHFVAGEGGPTKILNGSLYTIILEGKISLYEDEECGKPHIAVHELLHVFGFDHNSDPQSILYPTLDCDQVYNEYFFESINDLYEADSLPELVPQNIELEKTGRYIQFTIEVANEGLDIAPNVELTLIVDGAVADTFQLGDIDVGTKKIFRVENFRVARGARTVEFKVDTGNKIRELSEANNNAIFTIEG